MTREEINPIVKNGLCYYQNMNTGYFIYVNGRSFREHMGTYFFSCIKPCNWWYSSSDICDFEFRSFEKIPENQIPKSVLKNIKSTLRKEGWE